MNAPLIVAGHSAQQAADALCRELGLHVGKIPTLNKKFSDGEIYFRILESVRGENVFLLQSFVDVGEFNKNDSLIELMFMADAAKRADAKSITAVIPYYPYTRQDRLAEARESISAATVAMALRACGVKSLITIDLHSDQEQGFFDGPCDNLKASPFLAAWLKYRGLADDRSTFVSTDAGGAKRVKRFAQHFDAPMGLVLKERTDHNESKTTHIIGDFRGRDCVLVDDMIDTGGSAINAAQELIDHGAKSVILVATHAIFSGDAAERIGNSDAIKKTVVTDTVPNVRGKVAASGVVDKFEVVSMMPFLASAIDLVSTSGSISALYTSSEDIEANFIERMTIG